jgi:hypothetical protein
MKSTNCVIGLYQVAAVAYREVRRTGAKDHPAILKAKAAVRELKPKLKDEEAMRIAERPATFAAAHHSKWFWNGV